MPRAGERDIAKEQQWRQIVADQQASGLGVAEYCRQKGIIVGPFYEWNRKIRERDAEQSASNRRRTRTDARAKQITQKAQRGKQRETAFAEVQVVERAKRCGSPTDPSVEGHTLEVIFASGTKVRLSHGCLLELFASVVNVLENR
ncbi:MAG: IS66 family insertion sequence element accessory protein TnpA [Terriglobia bacterium]